MTKGNPPQHSKARTQSRKKSLESGLGRIRQAARRDKELKFTNLWHHVYDERQLRRTFKQLKRNASAGVDGETWWDYQTQLDVRLADLASRLQRGAYRPEPVRRAYIPKSDGTKRPLGIPATEDKIVQRAATEVLSAIYEEDFLGFSYGFRPGRGQHHALDALHYALERKRVNFVLDADIRGFFDAIDHDWLIRFVEHRITDKRVIRHIKKWLHAGVLTDDRVERQDSGTPQGGSISPLLANIYLHYVYDLWANAWRQRQAKGDVVIVRYADDFVMGFQYRKDAEQFLTELRERFQKFGLELHATKTRLIEFGRYAAQRREARGEGKPETFSFLGLTHYCAKDKRGWFQVGRCTEKKRLQRKLQEIKRRLRRRMHDPIREVGVWLRQMLVGHYNYYGVPGNKAAMRYYRSQVVFLWRLVLKRRSQKGQVTWRRMEKLKRHFLPTPRITHPYPSERLAVRT